MSESGGGERWPGVVITLWHWLPYPYGGDGPRVTVTAVDSEGREKFICASASNPNMTIDDPNITQFLDWAKSWYEGAPVREISGEQARRLVTEAPTSKPKRGRRRPQAPRQDGGSDG